MATGVIQKNMTLLWENPSPTATFAAQTVSLDLSKYRFVYILFSIAGDLSPAKHFSKIIEKGYDSLCERATAESGTARFYVAQRYADVTDTGITFTECKQSSYSQSNITVNIANIPIKIYGIQ